MDNIYLLFAFLLDAFIGDPPCMPHPVRIIGKTIKLSESFFIRNIKDKKTAGVFLALFVVSLTYLLSALLLVLSANIHPLLNFITNIMLFYYCFSAKEMIKESRKVLDALQEGSVNKARRCLSNIVGRDTESLNETDIVRATVETVAESIVDGAISPLFYAAIGGAPMAMAYRSINTLDSMVGYKNSKYIDLGWASARLDDLANFIPARISGIIIPAAAYMFKKNWANAVFTIFSDAKNHPSPNSGYPEAGMAGTLCIQLGGANSYKGIREWRPLIGTALRPLSTNDINDANRIMYLSSFLTLLIFCILF